MSPIFGGRRHSRGGSGVAALTTGKYMSITTHGGGSGRGLSPLQRASFRTVAALAFTGAITAPLVGIAAAQTGSLGSSGSGGSVPPTSSTAPTTTPPPTAQESTVELRVLVLDDGSFSAEAMAERLAAEGVEVERFPVTQSERPQITREMLADDATTTANYMGIVSVSADRPGLTPNENAVIDAFTADYGIREMVAFTSPNEAVGMTSATDGLSLDGTSPTLTSAALGDEWSYLDGPVEFDDLDAEIPESWAVPSSPAADGPGSTFRPLLTVAGGGTEGTIMGVHTQGPRERLIITVAMNRYQEQFKVLSHGMISWLTRGVSTSMYRNTFNVQIDDVFLADDEWNPQGDCTFGADCGVEPGPGDLASSRMTADDVQTARTWEDANGIELDMTFNAFGARDGDALTDALLAARDEFRWINHTWDHTNLDDLNEAQITEQIRKNLDWARDNDVQVDPSELVTGEHSGLASGPAREDNPALAAAMATTGVTWVGADSSVQPAQRRVGSALTVPRHPMNIFYNTSTEYNAADEYNWIYTTRADGGSGICEDNEAATCIDPLNPATGFATYIVPQEARHALGHALDIDPRPHYVHQSNITGDRILYPVLNTLVDDYRDLFAESTPLLNPTHAELGLEMQRRAAWAAAVDQVTATVSGSTLVVTNGGGTAVDVPVTAPDGSNLAGSAYAGATSGWITVAPGGSVTIDLGADAGFLTPTGDVSEPGVAARMLPQAQRVGVASAPADVSVVIPPVNDATRVGAMGEGPSAIG